MGEIVNLRAARKARARGDRGITAAANRALHGRTRQQKQAEEAAKERMARQLDGARLQEDQ